MPIWLSLLLWFGLSRAEILDALGFSELAALTLVGARIGAFGGMRAAAVGRCGCCRVLPLSTPQLALTS